MEKRTGNAGAVKEIRVKDDRPTMPLVIETKKGDITHELCFSPFDEDALIAIGELEKLRMPKSNGVKDILSFIKTMNTNFDIVFGAGTSKDVFKYGGFRMTILGKVLDWIGDEVEAATKEREKEEAEARKAQMAADKAASAAYIANK